MSSSVRKPYRLGDYIDIQNGYAFKAKDFSVKGIPIIKIKNLVPPRINFNDVQYFDGNVTVRMKQFFINKNDILISLTGSHLNQIASAVGKVSRYQFDYPALLNQRVGKVFVKNKKIGDETYLYYYLSRFETQVELVSSAGGSANQANISPSQIKDLSIDLPSLPDQIRIASILSSIDDKIELNCQTNQTLEAMAQAIYKEWFVDFNFPGSNGEMQDSELGPIPKEWRTGLLGEIVEFIKGVSYRSSELMPSKNALVTLKSIARGGGFNNDGFKEFDGRYKENQTLVEGDTVIAQTDITQNAEVVGCPAIVENPFNYDKLIASIDIVKCRPKNDNLTAEVIYYFLKDQNFKDYCLSHTNGSTVLHLRSSELPNYKLAIPDKDVLNSFCQIVRGINSKMLENNRQVRTLVRMRDSLLPRLMNGEIEV